MIPTVCALTLLSISGRGLRSRTLAERPRAGRPRGGPSMGFAPPQPPTLQKRDRSTDRRPRLRRRRRATGSRKDRAAGEGTPQCSHTLRVAFSNPASLPAVFACAIAGSEKLHDCSFPQLELHEPAMTGGLFCIRSLAGHREGAPLDRPRSVHERRRRGGHRLRPFARTPVLPIRRPAAITKRSPSHRSGPLGRSSRSTRAPSFTRRATRS
jgi:hypothetical protein